MFKKTRKAILIGTSMLGLGFVAGCGEESTDEANAENLVGTWVLDCTKDDDDSWEKETMVFTESTAKIEGTSYSDSACTTATLAFSFEATYVFGADASTQTETEGATSIDFTLTKTTVTLKDDSMVTTWNTAKMCGKEDWAKDTAVEITADCTQLKSLAPGSLVYDIFKATEDSIYFGDDDETNDNSTAEKRATKLKASQHKKQEAAE